MEPQSESVTAAAAVSSSSTVTFNINYITSPGGILKIMEIVFGLICWAPIAAVVDKICYGYFIYNICPAYEFVLFVSITSWILTIILFVIYIFALHATVFSGAPWAIIEFVFNVFWAVLYFIAACVAAAYTYNDSNLIAGAVFGFFTTVCYIAHCLFSFRDWKGNFPWEGSSSGGSVNA